MTNIVNQTAVLLIVLLLCGCGKSSSSTASSSPTPSPALQNALPKGPPPAPKDAIPADHLFDAEGFSARDLSHGEGATKLSVSRQWNGTSVGASHFGPGWSDVNAMRLSLINRDTLLIWRGGVGWRKAHRTAEKSFEGDNGEKIQQGDTSWSVQMPTGMTLTFDSNGLLTSAKATNGPARNYSYDKNNQLVSVGTGTDNLLKYSYNSLGSRVTRVDGPEGLRLDYTYDAKGRLATASNARKVRIDYTYSDNGVLSTAQDQFGNRLDLTQPLTGTNPPIENALVPGLGPRRTEAPGESSAAGIKQDGFGRVISTAEPNGPTTRFEYNNLDQPTLIAVSGELVQRMRYNEHGMLIRRERGASDWEEFSYDTGGRLASKRSAPAREQQYEYDAEDRIIRIKHTGGGEVTYDYGPDGRLVNESWSSGEKRHWGYNAEGQLIEFVENGLRTTYGYDAQGRLSFSEDPVHGRKVVRYGADDETTTETPDLGRSVVKTTAWGRPLASTKPGERRTTFRYDTAGRMAGAVPPSGVAWTYDYDSANRLRSIKFPSSLTTTIERDPAGRAQKVARGEVAWRQYRYDNGGRLQEEFSAAGSAGASKYDEEGRATELLLPEGKVSYSFDKDGLGRTIAGPAYQISEKFHGDGALARRTYQPAKMELRLPRDAQGRPAGVDLNEVKAAYVYDARGQVEQINLPGGAIKIARDDADRATSLGFVNTAMVEIKYDRADRTTRLEAKQPSGKALFNERYAYDAAGNLGECATDLGAPKKFEYDRDDRVVKVSDAKGAKSLRYDVDGNLSGTQSGNAIVRWGLDQMGRPTQQGPASFIWSRTGNLEATESAKGASKNSFDSADRLVRRTDEKGAWSYGYLPDGDRLWKESGAGKRTWYAYLPDRLAGFKDEAGVDWLLVSLPGTDWPIALSGSNGKTLFIIADRLGSARRVLDDKAAIVASADFDPFGNVEAMSGSAPLGLFAGMVREEGGLRYARQRYYDPQIARFISIDPEIGTVGNPATHNAYAYAGNNPLRYRDPLGTDFASEVAAPDSNIFNALTESQQAAVKEAWDGAQRANRVLNSQMKSTPAEMAAASRHLQECNAALAKMNEIGRARYKYVLLATGPTEELSAVGKANAARNTAEAKVAMEAMGEMPRVGRVNFGINAENLGSTLQNAPMEPRPISPGRAPVPSGGSGMSEAGTASRGAGAGAGSGSGGASTAWDENLFTGKSPINKSGRIPGQIEMVYDPKYGGYRPAVPSGSASSFASGAAEESGRWLGPKILNAGGKALNALGPVLKVMTAIDAARLGGTMAKNFTDNLNQPFKENQAINQAARDMANDLAKRLGELAASDPNAIILGDGRKFDPNNPNDIDEVIRNLGQNIYFGRKPFDGILKYIPKLDPNVLPKTYMGAADGDTALATTLSNARKLFATGWTARGTARDAAAELAKQEAEAKSQLESAMTTAGVRAVAESDVANVPVKAADLRTLTAAVQAQMKALEAADREMQAAISAGDNAATKICDYAARAPSASAGEIALWRKEATNDLGAASNLLNAAQVKIDGADNSIDQLASAIGVLEGLKSKLDIYQAGSALVEKADVSPDAALAAAKAAAALAETARTKLATALGEIGSVVPKMTGMLSPYVATDMDAATLATEALGLADGIEGPAVFNFGQLLNAALPIIDAAMANQKAVEKAISGVNLDRLLTTAREVLSNAQTQRSAPTAIPSGVERYRSLQTASQCFALIQVAPKVAEVSPTPTVAPTSTPGEASPTPDPKTVAAETPSKPLEIIVPDVSGFDTPGAMKAAAGPDMVGVIHATKIAPPEGSTKLFAYQEPAANSTAIRGEPLHIYIYQALAQPPGSSPSPTPDETLGGMPNLLGLTLDQASTRLTSNMSIGGDEVGDKPPTPEKAYTIFSQNPAPGSSIAPNKKVVVTVKRYGSAKTSEEPTPTPYEEQPSGSPGAGGLEGAWAGNLVVQGGKPTYVKVDIRKQGDVYMIYSGQGKPFAMQAQGNVLIYDSKLDFSGILGPTSKDTDPYNIRVTATLVGDELQVYMKGSSRREKKEGPLGSLKRLP